MIGALTALAAVHHQRKQRLVVLLGRTEECAEMAIIREYQAGKGNGYGRGFHDIPPMAFCRARGNCCCRSTSDSPAAPDNACVFCPDWNRSRGPATENRFGCQPLRLTPRSHDPMDQIFRQGDRNAVLGTSMFGKFYGPLVSAPVCRTFLATKQMVLCANAFRRGQLIISKCLQGVDEFFACDRFLLHHGDCRLVAPPGPRDSLRIVPLRIGTPLSELPIQRSKCAREKISL